MSDDANPHGIPRMMHHRAYSEQSQAKGRPHLNALSGDALEAFRTKATPVAGEGNDPRGTARPSALYDQGTDPMSPFNSEHWNRACDCEGPECTCG